MEKEVELKIPKLIINKGGKITPFIRGFLVGCFDYSEASIFYTTWVFGPGYLAYDKYKPNAITWFNRVYYSPQWRSEADLATWFRYVVHEQRHRHDIHNVGSTRFYFTYLREYAKLKRSGLSEHDAYLNISWEKKAYGDEDKMVMLLEQSDFMSRKAEFVENIADFQKGKMFGETYKIKLQKLQEL